MLDTKKRKLFGTDGVRGTANQGVMTVDTVAKIGMAAGSLFITSSKRPHRVIIAKDTRLSGYLFEQALTAGFLAVGMDVFLLGPMPSPAVAMLTRTLRADLGVMISASHNPYYDNGIKFFGPDGYKLSDEKELEIERRVFENPEEHLASPDYLGRAKRIDDARGRYIEFVKSIFPRNMDLSGKKIVIDCANGAAYNIGGKILWELGAEVIEIGISPSGLNINAACGSTHPEKLIEKVLEVKADIGIALDGDADRLIIVDENGKVIDGDLILSLIALDMKETGTLEGGVITTVISNLAMERFLTSKNIAIKRTKVGDRYVALAMKEYKFNLGGEPSGHVILGDRATSGDGIAAAIKILSIIKKKNQKVSEVFKLFEPFPQLTKNIPKTDKIHDPLVEAEIKKIEQELGTEGRILIRESGTEPLVRVMIEAQSQEIIKTYMDRILALL